MTSPRRLRFSFASALVLALVGLPSPAQAQDLPLPPPKRAPAPKPPPVEDAPKKQPAPPPEQARDSGDEQPPEAEGEAEPKHAPEAEGEAEPKQAPEAEQANGSEGATEDEGASEPGQGPAREQAEAPELAPTATPESHEAPEGASEPSEPRAASPVPSGEPGTSAPQRSIPWVSSNRQAPVVVRAGDDGSEEIPWQEGQEIPEGYVVDSRIKKGLVIGGAITFGVSWLASAAAARHLMSERESDLPTAVVRDEQWPDEAALYVPLAGPWIALGKLEADGRTRGLMVVNGLAQAGGLSMLLAGLVSEDLVLVRDETSQAEVSVAPLASPRETGATLIGRF